jgi:hypothetical protein
MQANGYTHNNHINQSINQSIKPFCNQLLFEDGHQYTWNISARRVAAESGADWNITDIIAMLLGLRAVDNSL